MLSGTTFQWGLDVVSEPTGSGIDRGYPTPASSLMFNAEMLSGTNFLGGLDVVSGPAVYTHHDQIPDDGPQGGTWCNITPSES